MIRVDLRLLVCVVRDTVIAQVEQSIVRLEHSFGQFDVEVAGEATSVNTQFVGELDA